MAFPRVEPKYESGERGEAQVKGDKKTIKLRFTESKKVYKFRRTRDTAKLKPGRYYVQLSSDETEVFSFHPWSGNFKGRVSEFVAKEGEAPVPKTKDVDFHSEGKHIKYSYQYFVVLIEILDPKKNAGITIPLRLNYNFLEAKDEEGQSIVGLMSKGNRTKDLAEFLKITGADAKPMKWKDNILPTLEKRILQADKPFNFIVKDGWIDTLYEADTPTEDADWKDEESPTNAELEKSAPDDDDEIEWEMDNDE
ncbi:MAG: hypothetical protein ACXACR_14685 [Candidatus Hodarchaeales archaeon]|jgi:hypothetical protein